MISEEDLVKSIKNRKRRIVFLSCSIIVSGIIVTCSLYFSNKILSVIENGVYKPPQLANINEDILVEKLPEMFRIYTELAQSLTLSSFHASRIYSAAIIFSIIGGLLISQLINELLGSNKDRIIVTLWEKLKKIEKKV